MACQVHGPWCPPLTHCTEPWKYQRRGPRHPTPLSGGGGGGHHHHHHHGGGAPPAWYPMPVYYGPTWWDRPIVGEEIRSPREKKVEPPAGSKLKEVAIAGLIAGLAVYVLKKVL